MTKADIIKEISSLIVNNCSPNGLLPSGTAKKIYKIWEPNSLKSFIKNNKNAFQLFGISYDKDHTGEMIKYNNNPVFYTKKFTVFRL